MSAAYPARATVARAVIWNGGGWNPGTPVTVQPIEIRYNRLYRRHEMVYRVTDDGGKSAVMFQNAINPI